MAHSKFAPSSASRWMKCSGSIYLADQCPEEKDSSFAQRGTDLHAVVSEYFVKGVCNFDGLNEFDIWAVQTCIYETEKLNADHLGIVRTEEQVSLYHFGMPEIYGTADMRIEVLGGALTVIDYKFGQGVQVSAHNNVQLMIYALGAAGPILDLFTDIKLVIIQPYDRNADDIVRTWTISVDDLKRFLEEDLRPAYDRIQAGEFQFNPGEEQCRWCRAKGICPALSAQSMELMKIEFAHLAQDKISPVDPRTLSNEDIARILQHINTISSWLDSVRAIAQNKLENGEDIPGYKLVAGRRSRSWRSEKEVVQFLKRKRIPKTAVFTEKAISPAQAEKAFGDKRWYRELSELIDVKHGSPILTTENDKRPSIENTLTNDFGGLL